MTTVQASEETVVTTSVEKKVRKPRSDKGVKRGKYRTKAAQTEQKNS